MNIFFHPYLSINYLSVNFYINALSQRLSNLSLVEKVSVAGIAILGSFTLYSLFCYSFRSKKIKHLSFGSQPDYPSQMKESHEVPLSPLVKQSQKSQVVAEAVSNKGKEFFPSDSLPLSPPLAPKEDDASSLEETVSRNLANTEPKEEAIPLQKEAEEGDFVFSNDDDAITTIEESDREKGEEEDAEAAVGAEYPISPIVAKEKEHEEDYFLFSSEDFLPSVEKSEEEVIHKLQVQVEEEPSGSSKILFPRPKKKEETKKEDKKAKTFPQVSPGKSKALERYQNDPLTCGKIQKTIIFGDVVSIESLPVDKKQITSVTDLMLAVSGLDAVDLTHPLCAQVLLDTFRQCKKELSEKLCEWLVLQPSFNSRLLEDILLIFIQKHQEHISFSLYSLELLIGIYKNKEWNKKTDDNLHPIPSNKALIVNAMGILIDSWPNEDRIINLAEWFMLQPDYDFKTFVAWIKIFHSKEKERGAAKLYYPLQNKLVEHFDEIWGKSGFKEQNKEVALFLLQYRGTTI